MRILAALALGLALSTAAIAETDHGIDGYYYYPASGLHCNSNGYCLTSNKYERAVERKERRSEDQSAERRRDRERDREREREKERDRERDRDQDRYRRDDSRRDVDLDRYERMIREDRRMSEGEFRSYERSAAGPHIAQCKAPIQAIGGQFITEHGAKEEAIKAWRANVRFLYGEQFLDIENAKGIVISCVHSALGFGAVGAAVGASNEGLLHRCRIIAEPCPAPVSRFEK